MKKKSAPVKKQRKPMSKASLPSWDKVKTFPVQMFHTFRGPLIGHVDPSMGKLVRLWAPTSPVRHPTNAAYVIYMPLDFVEDFVDLSPMAQVGASRVPDVIAEGYSGYVEEFIKGSYSMKPVAVSAGIEMPQSVEDGIRAASEGGDELPVQPIVEQGLAPCPACKQEVSNWRAHYPVQLGTLNAATGEPDWACEVTLPTVREDYPNYDPPSPRLVSSLH